MKKIKPSAELWINNSNMEHVARAARLCYAKEEGKRTAEELCDFLAKSGHLSMFRHASYYYVFTSDNTSTVPAWLCVALTNTPFVTCVYYKNKKIGGRIYFLSTNGQYLKDNPGIAKRLTPYEVSVDKFVSSALDLHFPTAFMCLRYTACLTTQIGTSRELNRTSPNNIAEQSTRYVNFNRLGRSVTICLPHWYAGANWTKKLLANVAWELDEWAYRYRAIPRPSSRRCAWIPTARCRHARGIYLLGLRVAAYFPTASAGHHRQTASQRENRGFADARGYHPTTSLLCRHRCFTDIKQDIYELD